MAQGRLTPLQERILLALAQVEPRWSLVGGGALVGFHTRHRETRDLDLFFRPQAVLADVPDVVGARLTATGLEVSSLQVAPAFCRLEVRDHAETILVDLVADPTPVVEPAEPTPFADTQILVETPHQLLVNKLCALLSRSELRDLVDVQALLAAGGELERALADCPGQDAGFSPLTFAWVLRGLPVERLARATGSSDAAVEALVAFRDRLVERVLVAARPA